MHVTDYWGHSRLWINGVYCQSGELSSSTCFKMIAEHIQRLTTDEPITIEGAEYVHYKLGHRKMHQDDIPEYVTDSESLKEWYTETTDCILEVSHP